MSKNQLPDPKKDFPGWYVEVVKRARMAEHSLAKGAMVAMPYGYAMWEFLQRALDDRFKLTGHENLYFPLLFPESLLAKEAEHVEGFSPELAVVTHGGGAELEEPLVVRPTSEAIIWSTYADWIQSYRDLPLLYNQWANVVRWELRTRMFLRTSEFLWQEGHTAHATAEEARREALQMLEVYREVVEDELAIPVLSGRKSESEKFAGADTTFTIEALMRDGKALQCGTSHFLGQNFSKAYDVTFLGPDGTLQHVWGTSWGASWRLIGGVVMTHGDERGLRIPPRIAPVQVVIVPIYRSEEEKSAVLEAAAKLRDALVARAVRVKVDDRDQHRPGFKFSEWELKGAPIRVEIGPKDVAGDQVVAALRATGDKKPLAAAQAPDALVSELAATQRHLFEDALAFRQAGTHMATTYDELRNGIANEGGFWVGGWCGDRACEERVTQDTKATIRILPLVEEDPGAPCVVCGSVGAATATWGRAY